MTPEDGLAAVFEGPGRPFRMVGYPLRAPGPGTILVRVLLSSICGSDVHAWTGRRAFPVPGILGHEIVGVIEAVGPSAPPDLRGRTLGPGQRVIWTEYVACGACLPCRVLDLPQKCAQVRKYGHERSTEPPHLLGGLAEYCYLLPGTGVLLVPDPISDAEAAPVSCGVATIAAVIEAAAIDRGDAVVVQGAGLLGLYAIAMARAVGAASVVALEAVPSRQALARRFGADAVLDPTTLDAHALGAGRARLCPSRGRGCRHRDVRCAGRASSRPECPSCGRSPRDGRTRRARRDGDARRQRDRPALHHHARCPQLPPAPPRPGARLRHRSPATACLWARWSTPPSPSPRPTEPSWRRPSAAR
jgi:threonine dehydrogenase-like Zn-dependent dehydrogenase